MEPVILHWVVQRNAKTGDLITYRSFTDYADALRHKAELEAIVDQLASVNVLAIESLPKGEFPRPEQTGAWLDRTATREGGI